MLKRKPKELRRKIRRTHTTLGCTLTHNRSKQCFRFCRPIAGRGPCGRVAPHSMISRTQSAIAGYKKSLKEQENA